MPVTDFSADAAPINAIARRGPGAGDRDVEAELGPVFDATLDQAARARGRHVRVRDLDESTRAATWRTYVVFMVAAAVLLFAACANVANLLLGRGVARRPEFVLRAALGSSRSRLLRQLLVESLIVAGAQRPAAGLALGAFGIRAFVALAPASYVTPGRPIAIDVQAALIAIALAALTAAVCGALPARQAPHRDLRDALASAGRRLGSEPGQRRLRSGLLAIQVTLAFLLLSSAGILTNSFFRLNQVPLGFTPDNVWTFRALFRGDRYRGDQELLNVHGELARRVAAVPGVTTVALANGTPLAGGAWRAFVPAGQPAPATTEPPQGSIHVVSPEYFGLLGICRLAGRDLQASDVTTGPRVAVINRNLHAATSTVAIPSASG